jgi:hypothetical protein
MLTLARFLTMFAALAAGYWWLRPGAAPRPTTPLRFVERAGPAGCLNAHSMTQLSAKFANIMPWLCSVGAAAAAADYDADGAADLYVINSGRGQANRLFHNKGDGTFEDLTVQAGVGCGNPYGASMHAVWGDIDNDGDQDLYVVKWGESNSLFRNDSNVGRVSRPDERRPPHELSQPRAAVPHVFTDISRQAGVDYWGYGNGATFLDFDRDGHLDLLVGNYFPETVKDPGTGRIVRNDLWNPASTKIMHETFTHARNGGHNVLYRNKGDGTFEDVTKRVGLTGGGWCLAVGSGDLNNDGWPDLYIANDFGPDEYYLNTGATEWPPRFRLVVDPRGHPGIGNDWWKGMNVDMGDVNNDGYLDIYVTNILSKRYKTDEGNMLWLNCADAVCPGGRGFRNIAKDSGAMDGGWGWSAKFADFNNDGLLDIYTVNGFVTGDPDQSYWFAIQEMVTQTKNQTVDAADWPVMGDKDLSGRERGRLFIQAAAGAPAGPESRDPQFIESAEVSGISDTHNGRGIALADFDLNGTVDMYIANQGAPSCYYINVAQPPPAVGAATGFLRLKLIGRPDAPVTIGERRLASTRDAVGARVTLVTKHGAQMREVQGGMGFASQSEYAVHFGVPDGQELEQMVVRWPSGRVQEVKADVARRLLNHHVQLVEDQTPEVLK